MGINKSQKLGWGSNKLWKASGSAADMLLLATVFNTDTDSCVCAGHKCERKRVTLVMSSRVTPSIHDALSEIGLTCALAQAQDNHPYLA